MNTSTRILYKETIGRYIKVTWTHKIQECQADIYLKKSDYVQTCISLLTGLTAAGTLATIMPFLPETIVGSITALLAFTLSYFTYRFKDGILESKARECKQYASKVHHLRNLYSSLLADMKAETVSDSDAMTRRDQLEQLENELYSQSVPHTTQKAVEMATKVLKVNQDSTTTDEEIQLILPEHLKI